MELAYVTLKIISKYLIKIVYKLGVFAFSR